MPFLAHCEKMASPQKIGDFLAKCQTITYMYDIIPLHGGCDARFE